jgi:hypothetical protein
MEALMGILKAISVPMTLAVGSTVAVVGFLWLATFSLNDIVMVGGLWLFAGIICAIVSLGAPTLFLVLALITGLPMFYLLKLLEPSNRMFRWWAFYIAWLYVWITAFIGWRYDWLGLLAISLPAVVVTGLGFFFVAGFLLPFPELQVYRGKRSAPAAGSIPKFRQEILDFLALLLYRKNRRARKQWLKQHRKSLRCLISYLLGTNYPYYVIIDEKIAEAIEGVRSPWLTEEEKLVKRLGGDLFGSLMAGPGIILTGCDHAVAVSTSQRFKGARGPGVAFTGMAESPTDVIDLRVQLRAFPVEAWTKDGIAVRVQTFVPFQIGTGKEKPTLGQGFPYRSSDVFKAVHAQLIEHVDSSQIPQNLNQLKWYDLPELAGERILRKIISRYELDDLYAPFELHTDANQDPRSQIATELREELNRVLPAWGIQPMGGGISNIVPVNKQVIDQRIEAWKADWARKVMLKQAVGQSRRLRLVERARAQAQVDVIMSIGKRIEGLRKVGDPVPLDAIVLYFLEVLEELSGKSELRRLLPGDTDTIIKRARGTIGPPTD